MGQRRRVDHGSGTDNPQGIRCWHKYLDFLSLLFREFCQSLEALRRYSPGGLHRSGPNSTSWRLALYCTTAAECCSLCKRDSSTMHRLIVRIASFMSSSCRYAFPGIWHCFVSSHMPPKNALSFLASAHSPSMIVMTGCLSHRFLPCLHYSPPPLCV